MELDPNVVNALSLLKVVLIDMDEVDTATLPYKIMKATSNNWLAAAAEFQPDVIVTWKDYNKSLSFTMLRSLARRWIVVGDASEILISVKYCWEKLQGMNLYDDVISVFTPVHGAGNFIEDTYASLRAQTFRNWEWVVTIDLKDGHTERILENIRQHDPRVQVFYVPGTGKIGAVKDMATRLCRGAYLIELDHDDILLPTALEEVVSAFISDPNLGFVYSDCSEPRLDGTCIVYDGPTWDGRYRDENFNGRTYQVADYVDFYHQWGSQPAEHAAWYLTLGPNHLRAFRTSEYRRIGGYNPNMRVADDWDLMVRFFMRSSCCHIPKFLYIQRHGFGNTQSRTGWNQMIQYELHLARERHVDEFTKCISDRTWRPALPGPEGKPKLLTVMITTFNRHDRVMAVLEELNYPEIAIKVISDGHDQALQEKLVTLAKASGRDIQYLFTPATLKPAWGDRQRLFASEHCDTEFLWYVDDDNMVFEGAVDAILDRLEQDESGAPDALFVGINYDSVTAGLIDRFTKIAPACVDDLQLRRVDTMNVVFRPAKFKWTATGYNADWQFIKSIKDSEARLDFAENLLVGQWRRA